MTDSDPEELATAAQRSTGDPAAMQALVTSILPRMRAAARPFASSGLEVDDIVQEALMRVIEQLDRYDPTRGSVRTWVGVITRSTALDMLRARTRRVARAPDDPEDVEIGSEPDWLTQIDDHALILNIFERLRRERDVAARRVLAAARDLAYSDIPLSTAAIAREAELDETTARRALARVRRVTKELSGM